MKRRRKLAEESEDEEEVTNGNTSKRARIEAGVDQVVKNLKTKTLLSWAEESLVINYSN